MIYRTSKKEIDEYFANTEYINQSALKTLIYEGVDAFSEKWIQLLTTSELYYEEKDHFIIGSGVDCKLTEGQAEFEKRYHISKLIKKPSDTKMSIIRMTFDKVIERHGRDHIQELAYYGYLLHEAIDSHSYFVKRRKEDWHDDTRINDVIKDSGEEYWDDLKQANGKQILNDGEAFAINSLVDGFLSHPHTSELFQEREGIDVVYQFPVFFIYKGVKCKGLIDKLIIDHNKLRILPCDLKTTGRRISSFNKEIRYRRYDIQGSFYDYGLEYDKASKTPRLDKLIGRDLSRYAIANFAFITQSSLSPGIPMVAVLKKELLEQGRYGSLEEGEHDEYGWDHGIELYKYWENYGFSFARKINETNGVVFIDEDFKYANILN